MFQSPEGDSLFFYAPIIYNVAIVLSSEVPGFSPPKGIRCFSTGIFPDRVED